MSTLRAEVLKGRTLPEASIGQIRLRLFKIAARLKASSEAHPHRTVFGLSVLGAFQLGAPKAERFRSCPLN